MIKNIVFDIGNVLVDFCWRDYLRPLCCSDEQFERVGKATAGGENWLEVDRGVLSDEELIALCKSSAFPEDADVIDEFFRHVENTVEVFDYAAEWIREMKRRGFSVYLLSNYGHISFPKTAYKFDFLAHVDGKIISYEYKTLKPERKIFSILEETYRILPEESIFIDDSPANASAAAKYGYHAIEFHGYDEARRRMEEIIDAEKTGV